VCIGRQNQYLCSFVAEFRAAFLARVCNIGSQLSLGERSRLSFSTFRMLLEIYICIPVHEQNYINSDMTAKCMGVEKNNNMRMKNKHTHYLCGCLLNEFVSDSGNTSL
jgi:hypothetical protein